MLMATCADFPGRSFSKRLYKAVRTLPAELRQVRECCLHHLEEVGCESKIDVGNLCWNARPFAARKTESGIIRRAVGPGAQRQTDPRCWLCRPDRSRDESGFSRHPCGKLVLCVIESGFARNPGDLAKYQLRGERSGATWAPPWLERVKRHPLPHRHQRRSSSRRSQ